MLKTKWIWAAAVLMSATAVSCGKGGSGDDCSEGNCGGGGGGEEVTTPSVDISSASGLAVTDPTQNAGSSVLIEHNARVAKLGLEGAPIFAVGRDERMVFSAEIGGGAGGGGGNS
ncbi:MAG: hypothetical protein AAB425_04420, partial [Bdellovibrionota bacterium]